MNSNHRIIVRSPNWIGDQILSYPFFYALRQTYPLAKIDVLCTPWVESLQFRNLVNDVFLLHHDGRKSNEGQCDTGRAEGAKTTWRSRLQTMERTISQMKREKRNWDLGICLAPGFSSAWIFYRLNIKKRRGTSGNFRGFLLNEKIKLPNHLNQSILHRSREYLELIEETVPSMSPARHVPHWAFDPEKAWPHIVPLEPPQEPYWVLAPGSKAESRRWELGRFFEVARKISQRWRCKGIIIGGKRERECLETSGYQNILNDYNLEDWTQKAYVSSYWKVLKLARFTLANDSGLAHLASLCGGKVYITWGAGNPNRTRPQGFGNVKTFHNPVHCWPCEKNDCSQRDIKFACLKGIDPQTVWEGIESGGI